MEIATSTIVNLINITSEIFGKIAYNTDSIKDVAESIKTVRVNYWIQFSGPIVGAITAGIIGLFTVIFRDWYEKTKHKSNLVALQIEKNNQNGNFVYRLILENQGKYSAEGVEAELIEIRENGLRKDFVPSPMRWTHINGPTRDIFPNQIAFLDVLEAFEQNDGENDFLARITSLYINHLPEIVHIREGETLIRIKIYQKNGQTKDVWFKIDFRGSYLPDLEIIK